MAHRTAFLTMFMVSASALSIVSFAEPPKKDVKAPATTSPAVKKWDGHARLSPFEAVRWRTDLPEVEVGGTWYEPLAIDDLPVRQIVGTVQKDDSRWQKHFEEDLVELLTGMGHKPGKTVTLQVKDIASGNEMTLKDVPMTEANRDALRAARVSREASKNAFPRLSPFEAVRWRADVPEVEVGGTWYKLLVVNDMPVEQVLSFAKSKSESNWQKHFEEDLVELLTGMGHKPGKTATLQVKDLASGNETTLKGVPMTEANRDALRAARAPHK